MTDEIFNEEGEEDEEEEEKDPMIGETEPDEEEPKDL